MLFVDERRVRWAWSASTLLPPTHRADLRKAPALVPGKADTLRSERDRRGRRRGIARSSRMPGVKETLERRKSAQNGREIQGRLSCMKGQEGKKRAACLVADRPASAGAQRARRWTPRRARFKQGVGLLRSSTRPRRTCHSAGRSSRYRGPIAAVQKQGGAARRRRARSRVFMHRKARVDEIRL